MKKSILTISVVVCVAAVVCMVCALTLQKPESKPFTPPTFDPTAKTGLPNPSDDMGYSELDAKVFKVSVCGKAIANNGIVDLYLTNPEGNSVWLKLRLLDEKGNTLGETGLIKPGEYVKSVTLDALPKKSGTTNIKLKIMAYEPETYYSAGAIGLNTTLTIR